jgi:hypothetical protein
MGESVKYVDPADLIAKLDWEGSDGITWFKGDEFEDGTLAYLIDEANRLYQEYHDALNAAISRAERLSGESDG